MPEQLTLDEREEILEMYEGLRVPDVVDALDYLGYSINDQQYLMDQAIEPAFTDFDDFSHRAKGFAYTARYIPPREEDPQEIKSDVEKRPGMWYDNLSPAPYLDEIQDNAFVVAKVVHKSEHGMMGSRNTLEYMDAGANGILTNAGARDIEELVQQGNPVYSGYISPQPGRHVLDETQVAVDIGGVDIRPGDLIVADASAVAVVPLERVRDVAELARQVQGEDQEAREEFYESLDIEKDETLEQP